MGKKQATAAAIVRTEPTTGRPFRVNSADLAAEVERLAGQIAELRAMFDKINVRVNELSGE